MSCSSARLDRILSHGNKGRAMRISIIIVTFNNASDIVPCLKSVFAQITPDDEVLVVDNTSCDGTAELVEQHYPSVRLLRNANTGYAGGNNFGATHAYGETLVFLNPDTFVYAGAIDALAAALDRPGVGMSTACLVLMHDQQRINTTGNTVHYTGLTYCRGANQSRLTFVAEKTTDSVSGAAFAIRRDLFCEHRGFDEHFFMYVEDTDLSWRIRLAGLECVYVSEAVVAHRYQFGYTPSKAFYLDRNRHWMLLKNLSAASYRRLIPGLCIAEIVTWGFLLLKGPHFWGVKFRVYRWLWCEWRSVRAKYRVVRELQQIPDWTLLRGSTHRLDFGQITHRTLAWLAGSTFHPAFRVAQLLVRGEQ